MDNLDDICFFYKVVESKGFNNASKKTGIPSSTLSRRVSRLERKLNAVLINRTTRQFKVTDVGLEYYNYCKVIVEQINLANDVVLRSRGEVSGNIKISCFVLLLHYIVAPAIVEYMKLNRNVTIEIISTNHSINVIEEGLDFSLVVTDDVFANSNLIFNKLGESSRVIVSSPDLIEKHTLPILPQDLECFPKISSMYSASISKSSEWIIYNGMAGQEKVRFKPVLSSDDLVVQYNAIMNGVGIGMLPITMIRNEIASNKLIRVLPDWCPQVCGIYAVYKSRLGISAAARSLMDFLKSKINDSNTTLYEDNM